LLFEVAGFRANSDIPELGTTAGEELLKVHRSYLKPLKALMRLGLLKGAAHITGGGITENTPRMLPAGLAAVIQTQSWPVPAIFEILRNIGNVPEDDYRRTFNLGIGMIVAVAEKHSAKAEKALRRAGETPYRIGSIVKIRRSDGSRVLYQSRGWESSSRDADRISKRLRTVSPSDASKRKSRSSFQTVPMRQAWEPPASGACPHLVCLLKAPAASSTTSHSLRSCRLPVSTWSAWQDI
jgi:hypothetical protein